MYDNYPQRDVKKSMSPNFNVGEDDTLDIRALLLTLWRRRWVIASTAIFLTVLSAIIVVQLTPRYTAEALLAIETRKNSVVDLEAVMSGLGTDQAAIKTEIDVLQSRRLIGKVVDKLALVKDPEFNAGLNKKKSLLSYLNPFSYLSPEWRNAILGSPDKPTSAEEIAAATRASVIDAVTKHLSVNNPPRSYTIHVSFESTDAKKAALIANTIADLYLVDQLEVKFEATERANEWLNSRVFELREKVRTSEEAAERFREEHQLVQTHSQGSVNEQQIAQLNSQLITARTDYARAKAREQQIEKNISKGDDDETGVLEVIQSPLIQKLKEQESEVQRKRAELATRYGPKHPKMLNVEAELNNIKAKIKLEIDKIVASIRSEAEVAAIRVKTLEENLDSLKKESFQVGRAQVKMRELEREVAANQLLLKTFLTRFKETSSQDGLQQADARIVSRADVPTHPSFPKTRLIVILFAFTGVGLGIGFTFLLEALDNGYRNFDQLHRDFGLRGLGMIPLIGKSKLKEAGPEAYLLSKPTSSFAEAHRNIHASLMFSAPSGNAPQVIGLTSSVPGEGKSTAALCLAHTLGRSGRKVLVVEADMRRPVMKNRLGLNESFIRLNDVLDGKISENSSKLYEDPISNIHILWTDKDTDPQHLFESSAFDLFLREARVEYDFIIIDTPPALAVSDVLVISRKLDALIFVVQWHKTPKSLVKSALKTLQQTERHIAGVILTQVDIKRHQGYGYGDQGYYYGTKSSYYSN
ncbi:GumC family protein [Kordiimonas marina]|uniref:GumC family protein n=1 Tax=Kordiimonas marina TaxID=2872312 RepID=UPI001FF2940A|nr:polysaccharide biosynthesis tyrosine autokinase [Kordiimonas marina]MCJ9429951.1 polysaccharide biosynthesis tyrosine autokinase [Kordiimonas marina]